MGQKNNGGKRKVILGKITCERCGITSDKRNWKQKYCRECAIKIYPRNFPNERPGGPAPRKSGRSKGVIGRLICKRCGKEADKRSGRQLYCLECSKELYPFNFEKKGKNHNRGRKKGEVFGFFRCEICGEEDSKRGHWQKFCRICAVKKYPYNFKPRKRGRPKKTRRPPQRRTIICKICELPEQSTGPCQKYCKKCSRLWRYISEKMRQEKIREKIREKLLKNG